MPAQTHKKTGKPRKLLTVRQVAELDICSKKALRRTMAPGLLEDLRVGPGGGWLRIYPVAHAAYRAASLW